jgi:hypothetical protein
MALITLSGYRRATRWATLSIFEPRESEPNGAKPSKKPRRTAWPMDRPRRIEPRHGHATTKPSEASTYTGSKREKGNEIASHQALDRYRRS